MKNRLVKKFAAGVLAALLLTGIVAFAADYGTSEDPLVTLSYITSIFKPSMITEINNKVESAKTELETKFNNQLNGSDCIIITRNDVIQFFRITVGITNTD